MIRYAEDGRSLLTEMAGDYQKNKECGDNVDLTVYFLIMWLIELKSLVDKGFGCFFEICLSMAGSVI
ncbi:hypothetical protein [Burkholderia anthina]|uniref:hypothetical protein n=1 Tax=Burkholderia anthina TaxID=179879 RepID=UPI00158EE0DF|nr:hypothetical protein [Burkholderia anthina]